MLLVFALCLLLLYIPLPLWARPLPWQWTLGGVCLVALVNAFVCWAGERAATRKERSANPQGGAGVFRYVRAGLVFFVLLDAVLLRWPLFIQYTIGRARWLVLVDDVVLLLPVVVMAATAVFFRHRFEVGRDRVTLSPSRYVRLRMRVEIGPLLVSWLLIVGISDLYELLTPDFAGSATFGILFMLLLCAGIVLAGPLILTRVWKTTSLPEGPLRTRLEDLCGRQGLSCRDLLVWHTDRHVHNAAVVGFLPPLRYILISDAMAAHFTADEVEAVFAHELGHVRLHHVIYYIIFAVSFLPFYATVLDLLAWMGLATPLDSLLMLGVDASQAIVLIFFASAYWAGGFSYLSRRFEREADFYAAEAADTDAFISALEKLGHLGGKPRNKASWRHFSIDDRLQFLRNVQEDPWVAHHTVVVARWLKLLLCGGAALVILRLLLWRPELVGL